MNSLKQEILAGVADELSAIEKALKTNLNPHYELVSQVAGHLLFAGGKRIRPLLMVLCSKLCGRSDSDAIRLSTVFEYLHAATLLHDDVVDDSDTRRGKIAAYMKFGAPTTVLTGDYLLALACSIATRTGQIEIIQTITDIAAEMIEGEIRQLQLSCNPNLSEEDYMDVINRKTAVLISGACKVGALFAGADLETVKRLEEFGSHIGMAFQISDDLLDYLGDPETTGKPGGQDLREGKMTLPLIFAMKSQTPENRQELSDILKRKASEKGDFEKVLSLIEKSGLEYTSEKSNWHIERATELLDSFQETREKDLILKLARYIITRKA